MIDSLIEIDKRLLLTLNGSQSIYIDSLMTVLTKAQTWIPLYVAIFYLVIKNNENIKKIITIIACAVACILLTGTLDDTVVKPLVARWRPTHDPQIGLLVDVVNGYRGGNYGFFSAHAANTFSIALFFSLLIRNGYLSFSLVVWSLVNCWTRIYLGVHYPGDIAAGLLWGAVVAIGVYLFYVHVLCRNNDNGVFISSQYTSTGYVVSDVDVVISVLAYIFIYAEIMACII
ncbi:MAG: phosphatase PAP2 family protein [Prevotella sp.]